MKPEFFSHLGGHKDGSLGYRLVSDRIAVLRSDSSLAFMVPFLASYRETGSIPVRKGYRATITTTDTSRANMSFHDDKGQQIASISIYENADILRDNYNYKTSGGY